ncbi:hypothetical protein EV426DRAFT_360625 [Tirmania nivea]|nr:hypothetical protein EV426DRAFT_360625 [Tirmania nivea]
MTCLSSMYSMHPASKLQHTITIRNYAPIGILKLYKNIHIPTVPFDLWFQYRLTSSVFLTAQTCTTKVNQRRRLNRSTPRSTHNMPHVSEKKESRHKPATQLTKSHREQHTAATIKTTSSKKPASTPKPAASQPWANKNSKPSTTGSKTTHEATGRPSQKCSTEIVPARKTQLQTMVMRPAMDGRCEWRLEVKGPTPGKTIVERGVAVRSGDKITTALIRVEHLNGDHKSSDRKDGGSSRRPSAGHRVTFKDTLHRKSRS